LFTNYELYAPSLNPVLPPVYKYAKKFSVNEQRKPSLNRLLSQLDPGQLVDSAWLQDQGVSRPSIHAYVQNGWLERVAPRVYRRPTGSDSSAQRWDAAILSAQELRPSTFYVGGPTALDLLGRSHYLRLGGHPGIYLYDPDRTAPAWLMKLRLDATLVLRTRSLFADTLPGLEWRRFELGTGRLGAAVAEPTKTNPWDHFLRVAGEERAAIEMLDEIPATLGFDHADEIFQGLSNLRPRLVTQLLETCRSVRAKRLFLFYADRHAHAWAKHVDRTHVDLGKGKRQLAPGGRLDARYQITIPASLSASKGEASDDG
tara:strand:- start:15100 stop:16044 length:945 start_codon:yes stop_codon:yes gene_type:complete